MRRVLRIEVLLEYRFEGRHPSQESVAAAAIMDEANCPGAGAVGGKQDKAARDTRSGPSYEARSRRRGAMIIVCIIPKLADQRQRGERR